MGILPGRAVRCATARSIPVVPNERCEQPGRARLHRVGGRELCGYQTSRTVSVTPTSPHPVPLSSAGARETRETSQDDPRRRMLAQGGTLLKYSTPQKTDHELDRLLYVVKQ